METKSWIPVVLLHGFNEIMSEISRAILTSTLFGISIILTASFITLIPQRDQSIAVIVSPWSDPRKIVEVISSAGGVIKTQDLNSWVAISDYDTPDRVTKLYEQGALLVIDASLVSACFKI